MTQPVQEPSDQRRLQAVGWRTAQLARRPPLLDLSSINLAMSYLTYDNQTIPDSVWTGLDQVVDAYINPAGLETLPGAAAPHMEIDYAQGQINFCSGGVQAEPLRYGTYNVTANVVWSGLTAWAGQIGILIDINPSGQLPFIYDPVQFSPASIIDDIPNSDGVDKTFEGVLQGNSLSNVGVAVWQDSGGPQDISIAGLYFKQTGWFCDCEGEFLPS